MASSTYKDKFIIGTGLNSLSDTISLMKISKSLGFDKFLIMPPAYYKYGDQEVLNFYSKIIKEVIDCKIILYNFEKLSGYKFTEDLVYKLVEKYQNQIIGVKDSSYNLFESLKIDNFSVLPGSENKLFKDKFGDKFVNYFIKLKSSEIQRFESYVTDWEHREYFEVF